MPNMNLVEVSQPFSRPSRPTDRPRVWEAVADIALGKEVCRVVPADAEGESAEGRGGEVAEDDGGSRSYRLPVVSLMLVPKDRREIICIHLHANITSYLALLRVSQSEAHRGHACQCLGIPNNSMTLLWCLLVYMMSSNFFFLSRLRSGIWVVSGEGCSAEGAHSRNCQPEHSSWQKAHPH